MLRNSFLAVTLLTAQTFFAQTPDESAHREHFFPLIVNGDGFQSYLFVTNVSDAANQCTLALQGPGLDSSIFQANDAVTPSGASATIDLTVAGASTTLTSTGAQALGFGHATLDCTEPAVARMLLTLKNGGAPLSMTMIESTNPGTSFQFPVLPRLGRLAMVFASEAGQDAVCAVELEDEAGNSIGGGNVAVPAGSTALQILDELIPIPSEVDAGTAGLSCSQDIAVLGLALSGPVITALPTISLEYDTAKSSHILPLILDGGGFRSQLLLTNLTETSNRCSIDLHGAGLNASRFEIPADATAAGSGATLTMAAKGDQASLLSAGVQTLTFGYATVACEWPAAVQNLLSVGAAGSLAAIAATSSAQPANGFQFLVVPELGQLALILNNNGESETSCAVELSENGNTISGTGPVQIPGQSTAVRFLGDLFDVPDDYSGGVAGLSCDGDVLAVSLPLDGAVFAAVPPVIFSTTASSETSTGMVVTIPDDNLRAAILEQLGKEPGKPIYDSELGTLINLEARGAGIESLEGLQYATELEILDLGSPFQSDNKNRITDLSPILELENLLTLDLGNNQFGGTIPVELGNLVNLERLFLVGNQLSGTIPAELGNLANLASLYLDNNQLSGAIPAELGNLANLKVLYLTGNQLSGDIPAELGNLANLERLYLLNNQLSGDIPAELGNLANLENLYLHFNQLSGAIPAEFGNLVSLERLNLGINQLSGTIPVELGNLANLEQLGLGHNQLSGTIPAELGNLANLEGLNLAGNQLSETIPAKLGNLANLVALSLGGNQLSGTIPAELGNLANLVALSLSGNQLSGTIPAELGNLANLEALGLYDNQLSGTIPVELGNLANLGSLFLHINQLSGAIPAEFGNLVSLERLNLGINQLSGTIPVELGNLANLERLGLGHNQLSGTIPAELGNLANLETLDLRDNQLSGTIPAELGNLANLEALNLAGNQLSGTIPENLLRLCEQNTTTCYFDN